MFWSWDMDDAFREDTIKRKVIKVNQDKIDKLQAFLNDKGITQGERHNAEVMLEKLGG